MAHKLILRLQKVFFSKFKTHKKNKSLFRLQQNELSYKIKNTTFILNFLFLLSSNKSLKQNVKKNNLRYHNHHDETKTRNAINLSGHQNNI